MKAFIHKIFLLLKSLFLRLHVVVTLRLGKDRVDVDGSNPCESDAKTEKGYNQDD